MTNFEDSESAKRGILDIVEAFKLHEKTDMTADERAVKEQKTLLYKWWCGRIYGHLYKECVCMRCKKENLQ